MKPGLPAPSEFAKYWSLDPRTVFLNHGSFGACPKAVLEAQHAYRRRLESQPVRFLVRDLEDLLDHSRIGVAQFANASPEDVVFVQNATTGVNTVFRSLKFRPGDEIIYTNHIYGACKRLLEFIAAETGAKLVEASFDFPVASPDEIVDAVLAKVSPATKIALVDHVTSATALVLPVETIVNELEKKGIDTMIDGAHALGSIPLDLDNLGAAYYTANCHKWLCAPKSAAILHVRRDRQKGIHPVVISHAGYNADPFTERFYWPGTYDPTAALCVGDTISYMASLFPCGWPAIMERNHELCVEARNMICNMLEIPKPCPDGMIASMATLSIPGSRISGDTDYKSFTPLQEDLFREFNIETPVLNWSAPPSQLVRIAVQLYNALDQYRYFAFALGRLLNRNA